LLQVGAFAMNAIIYSLTDRGLLPVAAPKGFIGSTLLTDEYKIQLLAWEEIKDNKTWTLLYKGSRDGFDAAKFHNLCDNKVCASASSRDIVHS